MGLYRGPINHIGDLTGKYRHIYSNFRSEKIDDCVCGWMGGWEGNACVLPIP